MCPLRIILLFLSAALAGFFVLKNLKNQPEFDDNANGDSLNSASSTDSNASPRSSKVKDYVSTRVGLTRVCLLIDTKGGMKPTDHELIDLMERSQTKYQVVLTKTDIVFPIDVARRAMQIEDENKSIVQPVMMVSSKSGAGIRSLRTVLAKLARFVKP